MSFSFIYLGLIPVLAFVALIAMLHVALPGEVAASLVFDPPVLMLVLNTICLFGVSVVVATIAMRAYLASGSASILLLGCGVLALGGAALAGGWVRPLGGAANTSVTIHNLGVLLGAILHATSLIQTLFKAEPEEIPERRRHKVLFGFTGTLILIVFIIVATVWGMIPLFWKAGAGSTPLKQGVLGTAITLFGLTSIYTMILFLQNRRRFLYWYSLALALTSIGLIGITVMKAVGDPIGWAGRTAQYLGGIYFLVAALSALREAKAQGLTLEMAIDRFYHRSEVHYRDLIETVSDAVISVDEGGRVLVWNQGAERMTGYVSKEAVGCKLGDFLIPRSHKELLDETLHTLREQASSSSASKPLEIEMRRKDDTLFPSEVSLSARQIGAGWTETLVVRDITERKRGEGALREAHDRALWLARFPEENPSPVIRVSKDGRVLYCNPSAEELPGWTCAVGQPLDSRLLPLVSRAMAGGDEEQGDVQIGAMFYSVWVAPFPEEGYANLYGRDITERKWAEDALKEAHDELDKRVQERTAELTEAVQRLQAEILQRKQLEETLRESEKQVRLFATQCLTAQETERRRIAAELHDSTAASLAAIKFRIEKTREDIKKGLDVTESLQDLSSNVAESLGEVRRIMTDLRPSVLDDLGILPALNWFCREYQKTYSHISVEKQIGIDEQEVPDSFKTPIFRISQEAMNNVAKHSRASHVNLALQKEGERILLTVQDNGQGFDPAKVNKGMGLSNIRERAELSGGASELQSTIGKGTTVRVWWPI
jgi:PAS domain S-box-containing protein